jgi:hypothetical protein
MNSIFEQTNDENINGPFLKRSERRWVAMQLTTAKAEEAMARFGFSVHQKPNN